MSYYDVVFLHFNLFESATDYQDADKIKSDVLLQ